MTQKAFNRAKKVLKFLGVAAILGIADSVGGSASFSVGYDRPKKVYKYNENYPYCSRDTTYYSCSGDELNTSPRDAIIDIASSVKNMQNDYFKQNAAEQIVKVVMENTDEPYLKYFAASQISKIADSMNNCYYQANVIDMATRLLGGNHN